MVRTKASILAELLGQKLIQHLEALDELQTQTRNTAIIPTSIGQTLEKLRMLRESVINDANRILYLLEKGELEKGSREAEELYALAGYYVEGAYHTEVRTLEKLGGDTLNDFQQVEELRRLLSKVMQKLG